MNLYPLLAAAVLILTGLVGGCSGVREHDRDLTPQRVLTRKELAEEWQKYYRENPEATAEHKEAADALRLLTTPYTP